MLAGVMAVSRITLQTIPGVHPLGLIMAATTLTYRKHALIPIYVYILLDILLSGFALWIIPYLYAWLPLWGMFMLAGKLKVSETKKELIYMALVGLHGLTAFGLLYAPFWALWMGLSWEGTVAWVIAGLPFDVVHAVSNAALGTLIIPLHMLLKRLDEAPNI